MYGSTVNRAGKIVETQHFGSLGSGNEDDEFDELNWTWELLSTEEAHDDNIDPPMEGASVTSYRGHFQF